MRGFLRRLRPDHLAGQIALLVFAALVLFQLALAAAQRFHTPVSRHPGEPYDSLAAAIVAVDLAPPGRRSAALEDLARSLPWSILQVTDAPPPGKAGVDAADDLSEFSDRLWPGAHVYLSNDTNARGESRVVVALRQGGYLIAATEGARRPAFPAWAANWPTRVQRLALFFLLCVTLLTLWISGTVVAPLVRLAREAERFPDESGPKAPLAEAGPREVRDLTRAVESLPEDFRTVVILCDIEGFTYEEIAEFVDCPIGTVRSRLHRGRKLLRNKLIEYARIRGYNVDEERHRKSGLWDEEGGGTLIGKETGMPIANGHAHSNGHSK